MAGGVLPLAASSGTPAPSRTGTGSSLTSNTRRPDSSVSISSLTVRATSVTGPKASSASTLASGSSARSISSWPTSQTPVAQHRQGAEAGHRLVEAGLKGLVLVKRELGLGEPQAVGQDRGHLVLLVTEGDHLAHALDAVHQVGVQMPQLPAHRAAQAVRALLGQERRRRQQHQKGRQRQHQRPAHRTQHHQNPGRAPPRR